MDLSARKIAFIQEFLKLQNEEVVAALEHLLQKNKADYSREIEAMSVDQFNEDIDQSLDDAKNNRITEAEELKRKTQGWKWLSNGRFASDKLKEIFSYYKKEAGLQVARKLVQEIVDGTIVLSTNPELGQKEPLLSQRPQEFRYLVCRHYKVIYWLDYDHNSVVIVHVFDCRQNPIKMSF